MKVEHAENQLYFFNNKLEYDLLKEFIYNYQSQEDKNKRNASKKYLSLIQQIKNKDIIFLEIHQEDLEEFLLQKGDKGKKLYQNIIKNTKWYISLLQSIANSVEEIVRTKPLTQEEEFDSALQACRLDNLERENIKESNPEGYQKLKGLLQDNFEVIVCPGPDMKVKRTKLRDLKADKIGQLVNVKAIVVKVTDRHPLLSMASYICETCQNEILVKVNQNEFQPPQECQSKTCQTNKVKGSLIQNFAMSKFVSMQKIRIQEIAEETQAGHIPWTYNVFLKGDYLQQVSPGDMINLTGVFLNQKSESFLMSAKDQLIQNTYIQALQIHKVKESFENLEKANHSFDQSQEIPFQELNLKKLVNSIAPDIFGLEKVKETLLVQLVGGSTIQMSDGVKIRGNINVGLIGDPGIAKSQMLKFIAHLTPRGIYTTGKGSSGAGLTATITKDPTTNEIILEGGALVLADKGICCIDEFDKMEEHDWVAIHEVMEQQTVSIAKAGITTRLNARASILAAANPIQGRYNRQKSPHENVNLPYSLLSRFDLMFIMLDLQNKEKDFQIASHITGLHCNQSRERYEQIYSESELKQYIAKARTFNPIIDEELHNSLCEQYVLKRKQNKDQEHSINYQYITPRSLLGIIRIAQAICKLRFSNKVSQEDIDEAVSLVEASRASLDETEETNLMNSLKKLTNSVTQQIYKTIKNIFKIENTKQMSYQQLENKLISKGFTMDQIKKTINEYKESAMLVVNQEEDYIFLT